MLPQKACVDTISLLTSTINLCGDNDAFLDNSFSASFNMGVLFLVLEKSTNERNILYGAVACFGMALFSIAASIKD